MHICAMHVYILPQSSQKVLLSIPFMQFDYMPFLLVSFIQESLENVMFLFSMQCIVKAKGTLLSLDR